MERQDTIPIPSQTLALSDSEGVSNASQSKLLLSQDTLNQLWSEVGTNFMSAASALLKETDPLLSVSNVEISPAPDHFASTVNKITEPHQPPHEIDIRTESFIFMPSNDGFILPQRLPSTGSISWSQQFLGGTNSWLNSSQPTVADNANGNSPLKTVPGFDQLAVSNATTSDQAQSSSAVNISVPQTFVAHYAQQPPPQLPYQQTHFTAIRQPQQMQPQNFSPFVQVVGPLSTFVGNNQYRQNVEYNADYYQRAMSVKNELGRPVDSISPQSGLAPPAVSPVTPTGAVNDIPSNVPYPGHFGFEVFFTKAKEVASKKTISYTFSPECQKLYVRQAAVCPIHFKATKKPPTTSVIRAMAIYSRPQDIGDVVKRCMNHAMDDSHTAPAHLIRTTHHQCIYQEDSLTLRHSVTIPWEEPPPGSDFITGMYQFMCFSSCSGTINRRPMQIIFTLENEGKVIGRQVVELRICACPGRDRQNDEEQLNPNKRKQQKVEKTCTITSVEPLAKRPKTIDEDIYTVQVRGRELYKLVTTIVQNYQLAQQYSDLVASAQNILMPPNQLSSQHQQSFANSVAALQEPLGKIAAKKVAQDLIVGTTQVADWLESIEMAHLARKFYDNRYQTMVQLENITLDTLEKIGIPIDDRDRLFASLLHWKHAKSSSHLSGLSTPPNMAGAFKISKTTISQKYKLKKSQAPGRIEPESDD